MFSEMFLKLWDNGLIQKGIWETIYMTVLSSAISYVIGLPLGVILNITDKDGINPIHWLNRILGLVVNFFRSIPFIILMVAMLPVAKLIVGVSLGNKAMIVMLVIAASPYVARMVESSLKEHYRSSHFHGDNPWLFCYGSNDRRYRPWTDCHQLWAPAV